MTEPSSAQEFESIAGELLAELGYPVGEPVDAPAEPVDASE